MSKVCDAWYSFCSNNPDAAKKYIEKISGKLFDIGITNVKFRNYDFAYTGICMLRSGKSDPDIIEKFTQYFVIAKQVEKHFPGLFDEDSDWKKLTRCNNQQFIYENEEITNSKMRLLMRYINLEYKDLQKMIKRVEFLPSHKLAVMLVWQIVNCVKGDKRALLSLLREQEFIDIIKSATSNCIEIDFSNGFGFNVNEEQLLYSILYIMGSISAEPAPLTYEIRAEYPFDENDLAVIRKKYNDRFKKPRILSTETTKHKIIEDDMSKLEAAEKVYSVDFTFNTSEKLGFLKPFRFLVLKSCKLNIVCFGDNFRIENIETVSSDVLKDSYDAIVILTKAISHCDYDRVKSEMTDAKLIHSSRTNRKLLIDDVFSKF